PAPARSAARAGDAHRRVSRGPCRLRRAAVGRLARRRPEALRRRVTVRRLTWLGVALLLATIAWHVDANPTRLVRGLPWMWDFVRRMVPPDSRVLPSALAGAVGTIGIALIGTALAAALAVPLGFLSARNVAPPALYYGVRTGLNFFRSIDTLVYALLIVAAVGLGPFPGMLAVVTY